MTDFIQAKDLRFSYENAELHYAVDGVSFSVPEGRHYALLGRNGSGKSTLARLINGLELPQQGHILIDGHRSDSDEDIWEIRRACGMVFQNPDNQIVASTVEEDVAFGPENLGVPPAEIRERVDKALDYVGLTEYATSMPSELSGGQKQKLAIAGILAMYPRCIILDEATSMLDPLSRYAFMQLILRIQKEVGLTVLNITHDMKEVLLADHVLVMDQGKVVLEGSPAEIFHDVERIRALSLDVPAHTAIAADLYKALGLSFPVGAAADPEGAERCILELEGREELRNKGQMDTLRSKLKSQAEAGQPQKTEAENPAVIPDKTVSCDTVIRVADLSYSYSRELERKPALNDVSFEVKRGEIFGIMGHSGSGKSTFVQHLNGLIRPQSGHIEVLGFDPGNKKTLKELRRHVGLLFQYPEHQLFAQTVYDDIAFGPTRMGCPADQLEGRVRAAAAAVGLDEALFKRSPFELSGGQKRRVAIAGVLAMEPDILILDEPAAGLDPAGREEMLGYVRRFRDLGRTVILVSHSMEDLARTADRILVLYQGRNVLLDEPRRIFSQAEQIARYYLMQPAIQAFLERFRTRWPQLDSAHYNEQEAEMALLECLSQNNVKGGSHI